MEKMSRFDRMMKPRPVPPYPPEQRARDLEVLRTIARKNDPEGRFELFTDMRISDTSLEIESDTHPTSQEFLDYMYERHGKENGFSWGLEAICEALRELRAASDAPVVPGSERA